MGDAERDGGRPAGGGEHPTPAEVTAEERPEDAAAPSGGAVVVEGGGRRSGGAAAFVREVVVVVVTALVLSLLIKTFVAQAFYIPSESMQQTLEVGDRVIVSRLTPGPFELERGDVVVFTDPGGWLDPSPEPERTPVGAVIADVLTFVGVLPEDSGNHLIKRIIGMPGDTVSADGTGDLLVNGVPVDEPYLYPEDLPSAEPFSVVVPEGRLWVMGDHRSDSLDSRAHVALDGGGTVPVDDVVGRAAFLVWPLDRIAGLGGGEEAFADVPAPTAATGDAATDGASDGATDGASDGATDGAAGPGGSESTADPGATDGLETEDLAPAAGGPTPAGRP